MWGPLKDTPSQPHLSYIRLVPGWAKTGVNQWKVLFFFEVEERYEENEINTNA
jgi:hypothetical protein